MPRYQLIGWSLQLTKRCSVMMASDGSLIYSMISFNGDLIRSLITLIRNVLLQDNQLHFPNVLSML